MNNDGIGQTGAGLNDRRLSGPDLQHTMQNSTGGPIKPAIENEMNQHKLGRDVRIKHLEEHYKR